jgi:hypothetical protein
LIPLVFILTGTTPSIFQLFMCAFTISVLFIASRVLLKATPGEFIWKLRIPKQRERLTFSIIFKAGLITIISLFSAGFCLNALISTNPALARFNVKTMFPFIPETTETWRVVPFYFATGAWPTGFDGKPVLYEVPYEKGPPNIFIGHIKARWSMPDTIVTIEGPRTPPSLAKTPEQAFTLIRNCILSQALSCLSTRKELLDRHIREMNQELNAPFPLLSKIKWTLNWFEVNNPALPEKERSRGIRLTARLNDKTSERYLLVNPRGAIQTFALIAGKQNAATAQELLTQIVGSLRLAEEINTGRAWINKSISETSLGTLRSITDPDKLVREISNLELLLIAKLSVDPASLDSYFHLGGIASILERHTRKQPNSESRMECRRNQLDQKHVQLCSRHKRHRHQNHSASRPLACDKKLTIFHTMTFFSLHS